MSTMNLAMHWRAWPKGRLDMRGVKTVGGWQCVAGHGDISGRATTALWLAPDMVSLYGVTALPEQPFRVDGYGATAPFDVSDFRVASGRGQLLPEISPLDTATWGCLLHDLAKAAGEVRASWVIEPIPSANNTRWQLRHVNVTVKLPTISPTYRRAEALLYSRVELREKP